jgi:hypothetical protein
LIQLSSVYTVKKLENKKKIKSLNTIAYKFVELETKTTQFLPSPRDQIQIDSKYPPDLTTKNINQKVTEG